MGGNLSSRLSWRCDDADGAVVILDRCVGVPMGVRVVTGIISVFTRPRPDFGPPLVYGIRRLCRRAAAERVLPD